MELSYNKSFLRLARKPILRVCLSFLIINAIIIGAAIVSSHFERPEFIPASDSQFQQALFLASILLSLPFFVDTVRNLNVLVLLFSDAALSKSSFQHFSKGTFRSVFNGLILLLMLFVYGSVFLIVSAPFFPTGSGVVVFIIVCFVLGLIFWKKLIHMHNNWEIAFIESMESESQSRIEDRIANNLAQLQSQDPWRVSVEAVEIVSDSQWTGKEIRQIDLRRHTGTTIAGIERGGFDLTDIQPHSRVFPHDKLFLLGEPAQIAAARKFLNQKRPHAENPPSPFVFTKQIIPPLSPWIGQPIKDTRLRSDHGVTIVGIQRASERVVSPNPDEVLHEGDLLLIMGTEDRLASIKDFLQKETHAHQADPRAG